MCTQVQLVRKEGLSHSGDANEARVAIDVLQPVNSRSMRDVLNLEVSSFSSPALVQVWSPLAHLGAQYTGMHPGAHLIWRTHHSLLTKSRLTSVNQAHRP